MISRNRASPCTNAQRAWLILAKPPARLPIKLDRPSSEDPVGVVAPLAFIATPGPFLCSCGERPRAQICSGSCGDDPGRSTADAPPAPAVSLVQKFRYPAKLKSSRERLRLARAPVRSELFGAHGEIPTLRGCFRDEDDRSGRNGVASGWRRSRPDDTHALRSMRVWAGFEPNRVESHAKLI